LYIKEGPMMLFKKRNVGAENQNYFLEKHKKMPPEGAIDFPK